MTPILEIKDLSLRIRNDDILNNVSLDLMPGQITGLVGRSGSGKSMTALSIMGLAPEAAEIFGEIRIRGENILGKSDAQMSVIRGAEIGMVFQEPMTALNPLQTIGVQVAETISLHSRVSITEALKKAESVLARVGLPPDQVPPSRYPHELSGGQRQRVVIAIAVAMNPKILIADEPTTALDVTTQAAILDLLVSFARDDGMAILLITHDLAVMSQVANRIAVMDKGAIIAQETAQAFFSGDFLTKTGALVPLKVRRLAELTDEEPPVLTAANIACDYLLPKTTLFSKAGVYRAVSGVTFSIRPGEILGLVGESGCGKSTLARALLGLQTLDEGEVVIDGARFPVDNNKTMRKARCKIQIVFQDPYSSFNPRYKIDRIIAEPLHLLESPLSKEEKRKRVASVLHSVGLMPSDGKKYPHEFSGGQRQRIALARALITNPSLIVLDEPTSALDTVARNRVLLLLQHLADDRGVSFLFITHDLSVIRDIADKVLVMKEGKIVEEGSTLNVMSDPKHAYTRALLAATPAIERRTGGASA